MTVRSIDHAQLSFPTEKEAELRDFYGRLMGLSEVGTPGKGPLPGHLRFYLNDPAGNALEFLEPHA